jgi:hypothetical protein
MKKLLIILAVLMSFAGTAQVTPIDRVQTIVELKAYSRSSTYVLVADSFKLYTPCSPCVANETTIFAGTNGRNWKVLSSEYSHDHGDLYYTQSEVNTLLSGKAATVHTHDDRYFTEGEITTMLGGYSLTSHNHDTRYYTETETDALILGKQNALDDGVGFVVSNNGVITYDNNSYALSGHNHTGVYQPADNDLNIFAGITPGTMVQNFLSLANPSAIRFIRINANNTISLLDDAAMRTSLDVASGTHTHTGADIVSGTINDLRLSSNIPRLNTSNTFSEDMAVSKASGDAYFSTESIAATGLSSIFSYAGATDLGLETYGESYTDGALAGRGVLWYNGANGFSIRSGSTVSSTVLLSGSSNGTVLTVPSLAGSGDRMVITNGSGDLSTQAIPASSPPVFLRLESYSGAGDGTTDNSPALTALIADIVANPNAKEYQILAGPGNYKFNSSVDLPLTLASTGITIRIKLIGHGARFFTNTAGVTILRRLPLNQTQADLAISDYIFSVEGIDFQGTNASGQKALDWGAGYSWGVRQCNFTNFDTATIFRFQLHPVLEDNRYTNCVSEYIVLKYGDIWGGLPSNSATNSPWIVNNRVFGQSGSYSHLNAFAVNGLFLMNFISEGSKPYYNIILDGNASTNVAWAYLKGIHFEAEGGTYARNTNLRIRSVGIFRIEDIYSQYDDTLFNSTNSTSNSKIIFDGITYTGALPAVAFNAGGAQTLSYSIIFRNINGGSAFNTKLTSAASWAGGVLPIEIHLDWDGDSGTGTRNLVSGGDINFNPGVSVSSKKVNLAGHLYFGTDNTYNIGGLSGIATFRPKTVYVAESIILDNAGRFYFGAPTVTQDVGISRSAAGQLSIINNGFSDWRDLKLRNLTATGTLSAIALTRDATTTDSAVTVNPSNGLLTVRKITVTGTTDASLLTSGTLNDLRLSSNVPLKDAVNTFTNTNNFYDSDTGQVRIGLSATQNVSLRYRAGVLEFWGRNDASEQVTNFYFNGNLESSSELKGGTLTITGASVFNGSIRFSSGAADGYFWKSNASGDGSWSPLPDLELSVGAHDEIDVATGNLLSLNANAFSAILNYLSTSSPLTVSMFAPGELQTFSTWAQSMVTTANPSAIRFFKVNADNTFSFRTAAEMMGDLGVNSSAATFLTTSSSANLRAALTDEEGTGAAYFVGGALGTPASGTLTNATGLPISSGVSGLGAGVATFLGTPSSANLVAAVTGETGTGALVFAANPTFPNDITVTGDIQTARVVPTMYNRNEFEHANLLGFTAIMEPLNIGFRDVIGTHAVADGSCRCTLSYLPKDTTLTGMKYFLTSAGAITGDNNNKFGIYTVNTSTLQATRVAQSTNDETHFEGTANTVKTIPFTSTYAATQGWYLMCYLYNVSSAAVAPVFAGGTQTELFNNAFWFANGLTTNYSVTAQTDLPTTIDLTTVAKTQHKQYVVAY